MHWSRLSTTDVPFIGAAWSIIATADRKADSIGRRNTCFLLRGEELVEDFCRCLPSERLTRARVHGVSNCFEFWYRVPAEIGALREVLAEQAVGVFI